MIAVLAAIGSLAALALFVAMTALVLVAIGVPT